MIQADAPMNFIVYRGSLLHALKEHCSCSESVEGVLSLLVDRSSGPADRSQLCGADVKVRCVPTFWIHWTQLYCSYMTQACARRPGAAASVSRRRRERRILLAGGGRRASRSHTLGRPRL